jgi:hypothetical protein
MRDLPIVVLPRCLTNLDHDSVRALADAALDDVVRSLAEDAAAHDAAILIEPDPKEAYLTYTGTDLLRAADSFQENFLDRGWGDGFPLVPPTDEKVEAMLAGTPLPAEHVVVALEPGLGRATVEKLAVNAVMGGCRPEHFPVLIAAVEAISEPAFNLRDVAMSTGPHAPLIVVNGPIVHELGINFGRGALGPGRQSRVNTVIGRALRLILMNVGKCYLGLLDLDTIGSPKKYGMCLAENERENPWAPLHVERGFEAGDNVVTLFSVESEIEVYDFFNYRAERLLRTFAGSATSSGANSVQLSYLNRPDMHNLILLAPEHAEVFAGDGWDKQRIREELFATARREWRWLGAGVDEATLRPEMKWVAGKPDELVPITRDPSFFHVCVVGGVAGKSQYLTGLGAPVSKAIRTLGGS